MCAHVCACACVERVVRVEQIPITSPEVGVCPSHPSDDMEDDEKEAEWVRRRAAGGEGRVTAGARSRRALSVAVRALAFTLKELRSH